MTAATSDRAFDHFALFYEGPEQFVARTAPFVREGVAGDEPVLVMTSAEKCERLAGELGRDAGAVEFRDMAEAGRNPARIIPAWRGFAERHRGRRMRGIGEPIWAGRSDAELVECQHHESLLNHAFADARGFRLLCPYDVATLPPEVVAGARRTHPFLDAAGDHSPSGEFLAPAAAPDPFSGELPAAPGDASVIGFAKADLANLRAFVSTWARGLGLGEDRSRDLTLAVHELATNSVRHGGGAGTLCAWRENGAVVCEVRDAGRISEPLAGRRLPAPTDLSGRGLWLVNAFCDLVQIRTLSDGNLVRVRMDLERS